MYHQQLYQLETFQEKTSYTYIIYMYMQTWYTIRTHVCYGRLYFVGDNYKMFCLQSVFQFQNKVGAQVVICLEN